MYDIIREIGMLQGGWYLYIMYYYKKTYIYKEGHFYRGGCNSTHGCFFTHPLSHTFSSFIYVFKPILLSHDPQKTINIAISYTCSVFKGASRVHRPCTFSDLLLYIIYLGVLQQTIQLYQQTSEGQRQALIYQ